MVFKDANALSRRQEKLFGKVPKKLYRIVEVGYIGGMSKKIKPMVSGRIPAQRFFDLDHPLSRRRAYKIIVTKPTRRNPTGRRRGGPSGTVPLLPVNEQTGELKRSYTIDKTQSTRVTSWTGRFKSRHRRAFGPTPLIIDRGYGQWLKHTAKQVAEAQKTKIKRILHT